MLTLEKVMVKRTTKVEQSLNLDENPIIRLHKDSPVFVSARILEVSHKNISLSS